MLAGNSFCLHNYFYIISHYFYACTYSRLQIYTYVGIKNIYTQSQCVYSHILWLNLSGLDFRQHKPLLTKEIAFSNLGTLQQVTVYFQTFNCY